MLALEKRRELRDLDALQPALEQLLHREAAVPPIAHGDHDLVDRVLLHDREQGLARLHWQHVGQRNVVPRRLQRDVADDHVVWVVLGKVGEPHHARTGAEHQYARLENAQAAPLVEPCAHQCAAHEGDHHHARDLVRFEVQRGHCVGEQPRRQETQQESRCQAHAHRLPAPPEIWLIQSHAGHHD